MEVQQALQEGSVFLRNGQDTAGRSPVNPDTLYLWDNQVQAIESYLADTEDLASQDEKLAGLRSELRDVKKQIELKVLEFELKQDGEELPPELSGDEVLEDLKAFATEMDAVLDEIAGASLDDPKVLRDLDDARAQLCSFLVETEPLIGRDKSMDKVRARARQVKDTLDEHTGRLVAALNSGKDD